MYFLVVGLPLCGTLLSGIGGHLIGSRGAAYLTTSCTMTSFFIAIFSFFEVTFHQTSCIISIMPWISLEGTIFYWGFLFDTLTCVMLIVVTSIASVVHLYSTEYLSEDPHLSRFMCYLSFFTFFMLVLITADNFLQMFVGWEGVGLCSYLLINFWYGRLQANKAALKAMLINRIGDFGLALAIFTLYYYFQNLEYAIIFNLISIYAEETFSFLGYSIFVYDFLGFFLFFGAVGKSAQLGLHAWLPDAMEGPTPVSALIHAATMVTAGVFLLCRCSPLLEYAPNISTLLVILGGITAFFAATTGLLQNDIKRVIAYSTCSQLGYMVFAAGLSSYSVSIFHLSNHAFFKALLFLGAGSVIHAMSNEQDMRRMGGLVKILPFTYTTMVVGSMALMGFPFLTGFYSKDIILEIAYGSFSFESRFVHTLGDLAAFLTAYYSTRLLALTFLCPINGNKISFEIAHDSSFAMAFPLGLLSFGSIFIGYISKDILIGMGTPFWGSALFSFSATDNILESENLNSGIKMIPVIFSLSGTLSAFFAYIYFFRSMYSMKNIKLGRQIYTFLNKKWFFDKVYNEWVAQSTLQFAYQNAYQQIDRGFLEFFGPYGFGIFLSVWRYYFGNLQFLMIFHYLFSMLFGLVGLLFCMIFWYFLNTTIDLRIITILALFIYFK